MWAALIEMLPAAGGKMIWLPDEIVSACGRRAEAFTAGSERPRAQILRTMGAMRTLNPAPRRRFDATVYTSPFSVASRSAKRISPWHLIRWLAWRAGSAKWTERAAASMTLRSGGSNVLGRPPCLR